jgi:hypothetical protein
MMRFRRALSGALTSLMATVGITAIAETVSGGWERDSIKGLYVRACLTNTTNAAHHCGAKA